MHFHPTVIVIIEMCHKEWYNGRKVGNLQAPPVQILLPLHHTHGYDTTKLIERRKRVLQGGCERECDGQCGVCSTTGVLRRTIDGTCVIKHSPCRTKQRRERSNEVHTYCREVDSRDGRTARVR